MQKIKNFAKCQEILKKYLTKRKVDGIIKMRVDKMQRKEVKQINEKSVVEGKKRR